jgi:NAD dependent epimerase/dehydratase family enzyme
MPWIHLEDLVSISHEALFNPNYYGIYNATTNEATTNQLFSKQLAASLSKPFFMPNVPEFILTLFFGEMANVLLKGSRVSSQKLLKAGFQFKYPILTEALRDCIKK